MRVGHIISFDFQGHKKWVVVNINDCRACIVPLANRDPNNPEEVFNESDSGSTGISPNSGCPILGRVAGRIQTRASMSFKRTAPSPLVQKPVKPVLPLPSIPDDPKSSDPMVEAVISATSRLF